MIYVKIKPRTTLEPGTTAQLGDVAQVWADAKLTLAELPLPLPKEKGIWLVDAMALLTVLRRHCPEETVTVLGDSIGWLHRVTERPSPRAIARAAAAWAIGGLILFSAFWFGSVLGFPAAQRGLSALWHYPRSETLLWVLPSYAIGLCLGALLYYTLIGRKASAPLVIKIRPIHPAEKRNAGRSNEP